MYVRGVGIGGANPNQLTWFDRNGKTAGSIGSVADYRGIELSPDEHRLAEHPHEAVGGGDLWLRDLSRETTTRLTFGGHNTSPVWSPDDKQFVFHIERGGLWMDGDATARVGGFGCFNTPRQR